MTNFIVRSVAKDQVISFVKSTTARYRSKAENSELEDRLIKVCSQYSISDGVIRLIEEIASEVAKKPVNISDKLNDDMRPGTCYKDDGELWLVLSNGDSVNMYGSFYGTPSLFDAEIATDAEIDRFFSDLDEDTLFEIADSFDNEEEEEEEDEE